MATLDEVPFGPSFGSIDATPLWLVLLGETSDWIGDPVLLDRLWPTALRALDWVDARTAADPDGFLRYLGRPGALANEGWKDSPDAIRDRSGAIVPAPIALAEVQGYVYDAWRRMARMARGRADPALADRLTARARRLRRRFDAAFWIGDRETVALALGRDGRVADAISSNAGQCLWTGILNVWSERAVARRTLARDMDSGWGIRTLGAAEPAFDPGGYHTGSVWPHDTALIVGGLRRAGFDEAAQGLADRLLEAAGALAGDRLPELISGDGRLPGLGPGPVARACPVQAWASAAPLHLVRSLLGLQPHAAFGRLILQRPALPTAVGAMRISGIRVGSAQLDLGISRTRRGIRVRRLGPDGPARVVVSTRP
jgi:glycogen debranching enzyme